MWIRLAQICLLGILNFCFTKTASTNYAPHPLAMITTGNRPSNLVNNDADYTHKVNVRVNDVLTRQKAAESVSYSYNSPISPTQSFSRKMTAVKQEANDLNAFASPLAHIKIRSLNSPPANALVVPLARSHSVIKEDRSWPPEHSQEFARVDVRIMGEKMDSKVMLHLRPNSSDASIRKLRRILGPDFKSKWMSIDPPAQEPGKITRSLDQLVIPKPDEKLLAEVETLNFTILRKNPGTDMVFPVEMNEEQIKLVKDWLLQRATCHMEHIWEDMGSLFWPRYIKRGICVNTQPCSWPTGMRCRPSGSLPLKLLRWVCTNDMRHDSVYQNRWRRGYRDVFYQRSRRDGQQQQYRLRRVPRADRRAKRVRRLIRKLSLTADGYHCEWNTHDYIVTHQCSCS